MSEAYQFAIGRSRALILAGCFVAAAVLLFFAGAITGTLYTSARQSSAQAVVNAPVVKAPELPSVKAPEAGAGSSAPSEDQAASAAEAPASGSATSTPAPEESPAPASAATPPSAMTSANAEASAASTPAAVSAPPTNLPAAPSAVATVNPRAAAKPASAPAPPAIAAPSYAIQLAVRVGSFSVKSNAEAVTQSLRDMGYQPALSRSIDLHGRVWYVVKLGPYTKWNTASAVATRVAIAESVTPVIGPTQ